MRSDEEKEAALIAKTAELEALIAGVNMLTDDPVAFLDKIEAIIIDTMLEEEE